MTSATDVPTDVLGSCGLTSDGLWCSTFRSMASPVRILLEARTSRPHQCCHDVQMLFAAVERECTRFDPASDLMQANAAGSDWCAVGRWCFDAVLAAYDAYMLTGGTFDPRVLRSLVALGYGATWARASRTVAASGAPAPPTEPWTPDFDETARAIRVGPEPIDLGGIAKGLALRWAAEALRERGASTFLVDAGGDVVTGGDGPGGAGWHVGVEDPGGRDEPVAVLGLSGQAVATSSTRLRSWRSGDETVHHLIDPRTGRSARVPVDAVTVVADDPAEAEVWSKTLFVDGMHIGDAAAAHGLAALWVGRDSTPRWSSAMADHLLWWAM
jgi:thiamine biosynthesis lipoprotein